MNNVNWIPVSEAKEKADGTMWVTSIVDGKRVVDVATYEHGYWFDISQEWSYGGKIIAFAKIEYPLPYETEEEGELKKAKQFIASFCKAEYGQEADFTNLKEIPILYSTYGDDEAIEVQVNVDLINHNIIFLKRDWNNNEDEYSVYKVEKYASIKEMNEYRLEWMDFNDLYAEYDFD